MLQEVDDRNWQKETVCAKHCDYMAVAVKLQLMFYFFFFFNSMVRLLLQWINALTNSHCLAAVPRAVEDGLVFRSHVFWLTATKTLYVGKLLPLITVCAALWYFPALPMFTETHCHQS